MLDLSKKQKKFFVVKLTNGTTLSIPSPKKRIFERMTAMNDISLDTVSAENINEIYELIAEILSSNTQKKKYTADEVGEMLDFSPARCRDRCVSLPESGRPHKPDL